MAECGPGTAAVAVRLDSTNDAQARWKGKAANTFRDTLNGQRATISNLCASCTDNAEVLSEWAAHLRDLQLEARRLERGAAAAGLQSWAGAGRSAVQGAQSAAGVSGGHDPDLLGGFASGFVHSVENLHERYLEASRDFAHRVAALLDLPTGTKGRYGSGTGVLAGQLLVTAAPLVSAGISGDSGLRELSIPIDNDQPYELTGEPWPPSTTTPDGVFQKNEQDDYDSSILGWIFTEENDMDEASAALIGMYALGLPHAAHWFNHYLNGSGSDLNFDAAQPYKDDPRFRSLVNGTIRTKITESPGEPDFDSGYLYHAAPFSTDDWHNAIGGRTASSRRLPRESTDSASIHLHQTPKIRPPPPASCALANRVVRHTTAHHGVPTTERTPPPDHAKGQYPTLTQRTTPTGHQHPHPRPAQNHNTHPPRRRPPGASHGGHDNLLPASTRQGARTRTPRTHHPPQPGDLPGPTVDHSTPQPHTARNRPQHQPQRATDKPGTIDAITRGSTRAPRGLPGCSHSTNRKAVPASRRKRPLTCVNAGRDDRI